LENSPIWLPEASNAEAAFEDGVVGIGLQKRFNLIIDYPNNKMYLKPSCFFDEPFFKKKEEPIRWILWAVLGGIIVLAILIWRRRFRKK
jgi:hypothetical protein